MRHGSLFSGIGGFDLAAEWMGWENVFSCEIEEFPRKVLQHHFPNTIHYEDIKRTDFSVHRGDIDILSGGFPCQPYSIAGKRLGKNDDRHLWPEMYRAICEIAPRYVVGENVRGLVSWDGGLVLDEMYADLEAQGYEVGTFVLPAAGINAPHKRERTWIIAKNTMLSGLLQRESVEEGAEVRQQRDAGSRSSHGVHREEGIDASNTERIGHGGSAKETRDDSQEFSRRVVQGQRYNWNEVRSETQRCGSVASQYKEWLDFPTQSPVCGGDDGFPRGMDNLTVSRWRIESIKAYGNAIVPQLAYRIFKAIEQCQ